MYHRDIVPSAMMENMVGPGSNVHMPALALWEALPRLGTLADAAFLDLDTARTVAANAVILDVEHGPRDFIVRHFGSAIEGFVRGDQTGLRFTTDPSKAAGSEIWQQLDSVVESGEAAVYETPYTGNFWDFYGIRQLVCPLTHTGERVDRLFTSLAFLPK